MSTRTGRIALKDGGDANQSLQDEFSPSLRPTPRLPIPLEGIVYAQLLRL